MASNSNDDMSMEDILASIRQYVSTTNEPSAPQNSDTGKVVPLSENLMEEESQRPLQQIRVDPPIQTPHQRSPFSKLQEVKKKTEQESVVMQCLKDIISEWLHAHPELVEKAIHKAIKKELED